MDNKENTTQTNEPSRRKFVWGMGILSAFAAVGSITGISFWRKKKPVANKKQTVKMLTQDGRLVEVDVSKISGKMKKVTNTEMQHWIKK
ncbi:hypothetical protein [uncultured Mucilaginibacter sp.]|uniref:hypothetical protein n=1 Tax=uncultured Mucilaginibacter sp. TaxID=797541 RepID=UPI0025FA2B0D|nr:hypothetical protein [uncultured Mucilaginibacter sp.]